jgi:hypothetical protein
MAEVEAEDLEPVRPLTEVRFLRIAHCRVAREACRDDEMGARAQQLEPGLIPDLHASAGQQRHPAAQVGKLGALREVELRARRTELIVEVMDDRVLLFTDVTVLQLPGSWLITMEILRRESPRGKHIGRREYGFAAKRSDSGLRPHVIVPLHQRGPALALPRRLEPPRITVGAGDARDRLEKPLAIVLRHVIEHTAIGSNRLHKLSKVAQSIE